MKILVTGYYGYIGPHLVDVLKAEGHHVTGVDLGLFADCKWYDMVLPDTEIKKDIRSLTVKDLEGYDCVMHLAAISNDPMGSLDPEITYSINRDGSILLAKLAKEAGVPRFLFSSSCSIYGAGGTLDLDESAAVNPLSAYAESKISAEESLSKLADENFCPVSLRNSTAYGDSPMFRIDLVVNNLLTCAFTKGEIRIASDGTPWRPLIHSRDIARAFVAFLNAPRELIFNRRINVGSNSQNYQVKDVADGVARLLPAAKIIFTGEATNDPRNYRVNFDLLSALFPDFKLAYDIESGMDELFKRLRDMKFSLADFNGDQFVRLRALQKSGANNQQLLKKIQR